MLTEEHLRGSLAGHKMGSTDHPTGRPLCGEETPDMPGAT